MRGEKKRALEIHNADPKRPHLLNFSPHPVPLSSHPQRALQSSESCLAFIYSSHSANPECPARCTRAYSVDPSHIKYASTFKARPALPNPLTDSRLSFHPTRRCQSQQPGSSGASKSISGIRGRERERVTRCRCDSLFLSTVYNKYNTYRRSKQRTIPLNYNCCPVGEYLFMGHQIRYYEKKKTSLKYG